MGRTGVGRVANTQIQKTHLESSRIQVDRVDRRPGMLIRSSSLQVVFSNQTSGHFGGHHHARRACSGLGARAHKIEIADVFGAVVWPEEGGLREHGFHPEGVAEVTSELAFEVVGRDPAEVCETLA